MVTMMEHPKHGRHPATGAEIEALKANGWQVMPPKSKVLAEAAKEEVQDEEEPRQKRAYTRRAG